MAVLNAETTTKGVDLVSFFVPGTVTTLNGTSTSYTYRIVPSQFLQPVKSIDVTGSGFTFNFGYPSSGTINSMSFSGMGLLTGLSVSATEFEGLLFSPGGLPKALHLLMKGNDTLTGGANQDVLDPGIGADQVNGGGGQDIVRYTTDARMEGVTIDLNNGDPADEIGKVWSGTAAAPGAGVEVDMLNGIEGAFATTFADVLIGDNRDNVFLPFDGSDTIDGGAGRDQLSYSVSDGTVPIVATFTGPTSGFVEDGSGGVDAFSNIEVLWGTNFDDILTGSAGLQTLFGGDGQDFIDGGLDRDQLAGGQGGDTYVVDTSTDLIEEVFDQGSDAVLAKSSYDLGNEQSIERLEAYDPLGTVGLSLGGNDDANTIAGNAGNNTLRGRDGNDTLDGRGGNDVLSGGEGNDTYWVDRAGDSISEGKGLGRDTVLTAGSYKLGKGDSIESLKVASSGSTNTANLIGNEFANAVAGNAGANRIDGRAAKDLLTGGRGKDAFQFSTKLNGATNVDRITDFSVKDDTIRLENAIFKGLKAGKLGAGAFTIGKQAKDASDRVVYDKATGALYFDADGSGSGAAVKFAILKKGLALTAADFLVY